MNVLVSEQFEHSGRGVTGFAETIQQVTRVLAPLTPERVARTPLFAKSLIAQTSTSCDMGTFACSLAFKETTRS